MSDPLSDPRAQQLLSASTGEIAALAGAFHRVANQAQTAATGLRGAQHDATWTGAAATAFRAQVGKLPGDLDKVQQSYGEVASALDTYRTHLGPMQAQFRALATQLHTAQSSLSTAQGQLTTAKSNLSTATGAPHAKPTSPAVVSAHSAVTSATGAVGNLQGQVSGLQSRGFNLLDEFDTIRGTARSRVSSAAGIAPSHSWLSGALSSVGHFVEDAAVGIAKSVLDLPHAIANVYEHPGDLAAWGELIKDVAVTASLVAMLAAPFAAPELAEADVAVDGAAEAADAAEGADAAATAEGTAGAADSSAPTLGSVARGVNTWGNRVALSSNALGGVDDAAQGHWGAAGIDAAFLIAPNLGSMPKSIDAVKGFGDNAADVLGIGDRAADQAAEAAQATRNYQVLKQWGINSAGAKSLAFEDGVPPAALRGVDLENPSAVRSAVTQLNAYAGSTAGTAMHYGKPAAYLIDSLGSDPGSDKIKHAWHLVPDGG